MKKVKLLTLTSTLISTVGVFAALDVGNRVEAIVTTGNPSDYFVYSGTGYDGVVQLQDANGRRCTGSLLPTGLHILTTAHCLTQENSAILNTRRVGVIFDLPNTQPITLNATEFYLYPDWIEVVPYTNDLAIIGLDTRAPVEAERYDIYRDSDELGKNFTKVGYGRPGTGKTGENVNFMGRTKLFGQNTYDYNAFRYNSNPNVGKVLGYDFDSGLSENNVPPGNLGLGLNEVNIAPGDSGGPGFINGLIAGVSSFTTSFSRADIDYPKRNSTFGELAYDTRVSYYASYIDDVLAGKIAPTRKVPEPSTVLGTVFTLGALAISSRSRRKEKALK